MLYTLTMNPAIDMNISSRGLAPRKVNRTFDALYTPNGKGLNVSFVLGHYGVTSGIMGFFGDFSGRYIVDETRKMGYKVAPVWIDEPTRINVFLYDGSTEYKLVNAGPFVPKEKQQSLLKLIEDTPDMTCLSISGSLPGGIDDTYYDSILSICERRKVDVILDISSKRLSRLLKFRPLLIKPNDEEVGDIFGLELKTEEDMIGALRLLHDEGARNILLTLGENGSYFYDGAHIYYANARPVKLLSSVCAGDSALAAFLSVWMKRPDQVTEALTLSAATGANVAESSAIGDLKRVEEYKKDIKVRRVL